MVTGTLVARSATLIAKPAEAVLCPPKVGTVVTVATVAVTTVAKRFSEQRALTLSE